MFPKQALYSIKYVFMTFASSLHFIFILSVSSRATPRPTCPFGTRERPVSSPSQSVQHSNLHIKESVIYVSMPIIVDFSRCTYKTLGCTGEQIRFLILRIRPARQLGHSQGPGLRPEGGSRWRHAQTDGSVGACSGAHVWRDNARSVTQKVFFAL